MILLDPICSVKDCGKPRSSRGLCKTHYSRWRRNGDPLAHKSRELNKKAFPEPGMKRCPCCEKIKPFAEYRPNKAQPSGLNTYCKPCHVVNANAWRARNPEKVAKQRKAEIRKNRKRKYGLTESQYREMIASIGNQCPICSRVPKRWAVDHDHATNVIRGVICTTCNTGIGLLGDNEEGLLRALAYLRKTRP